MSSEKLISWAFIFARGGSKGIPRKNLKMLGGVPLVAHSIKTALETSEISRVILSTDDEEIASVGREYGADVPFLRPSALASDTASEFLAWRHAIEVLQIKGRNDFDIFVSLPPTSPFRSSQDISSCIGLFKTTDADIVTTMKTAARSPYFNMLCKDDCGFYSLVNKPSDRRYYTRRQDVPDVFDMTTVAYVTSADFILNNNNVFDGRMQSVLIPPVRAIDIDTPLDFAFAEFIVSSGLVL